MAYKICPLKFNTLDTAIEVDPDDDRGPTSCDLELCAWWDEDTRQCAVLTVAKGVKVLADGPGTYYR